MKWWQKGILLLFTGLMLLGFSSMAMASYDPTAKVLSKLQGQWYDKEGNVVLDFQDNTVNSCPVIGVYRVAGGGGDFSCIVRIVESDGYRDLPLDCDCLYPDSYHPHVILKGYAKDGSKNTLLLRTLEPQYYESVGGIYLDMTEEAVRAKYGNPDTIIPKTNGAVWSYQRIGLELTMMYQRVHSIRIYRNGNRRFDRTGFNCENMPYEFQSAYGFRGLPKAGVLAGYKVVPGEYMWFNDYPNSITLSMYWN